jgi:hypothetical protein
MNDSRDELDLDWLAFCYAAGELDAEQAAKFEALLLDSQDARERLATIVALTENVARVPVPAAAQRAGLRRNRQVFARIAWLAAAAAALVAAIWLGRGIEGMSDPGERETEPREVALADVWATSLIAPADSMGDDGLGSDLQPIPLQSEAGGEDAVDVPEWMIAALGDENSDNEAYSEEETGEFEEMFPEAHDVDALQDG